MAKTTAGQALQIGQTICSQAHRWRVDPDTVTGAEYHFCPQYFGAL